MQCGNEVKMGDKFCNKCGKAVQGEMTSVHSAKDSFSRPKKKNKFMLITIVVVIFVGIIAACISNNKGYEKPFEYLEKGVNNCDTDAFVRAFHPELLSEDYVPTDEDMLDEFGRYGTEIHFEILDAEKLTEEELEYYREDLGKIKSGYRVKVDFSIEAQTDIYSEWSRTKTYSEVKEVNVVKSGGNWYFADEDVLW